MSNFLSADLELYSLSYILTTSQSPLAVETAWKLMLVLQAKKQFIIINQKENS